MWFLSSQKSFLLEPNQGFSINISVYCRLSNHHSEESDQYLFYGLVTKSCPTLATPWTVVRQAALSMGFSRQEYWSGLPFPSPGDLPNPGIEPRSLALQADSLLTELWEKSIYSIKNNCIIRHYLNEQHNFFLTFPEYLVNRIQVVFREDYLWRHVCFLLIFLQPVWICKILNIKYKYRSSLFLRR